MKKILAAASLALSVFFIDPVPSRADWNTPQTRHGYGWLAGRALNSMPWLHFHGPLYNYGPYTAPGHVPMWVKNPHHGSYVPAYSGAYYGYDGSAYYPNTIAPYYPANPMQSLAAPSNFYPQSQAEPPMNAAAPLQQAPASATVQPAAAAIQGNRTPVFFSNFRNNRR